MSNALVPVQDIERMALAVAKSGLFGVTTLDQAMALMLVAQAEGLHPAVAARDYHIIKGRPTLKSDAMLARFLQAGGRVEWLEYTDQRVAAKFSHPAGGSIEVDWTSERVQRADSTNKGMHKQYPRQMLRARVISEGVRTVFPGCTSGMYAPEEFGENGQQQPAAAAPASPKNMGNAEIVTELQPVLDAIKLASTLEGLELIRPDIRRLRGDDKQAALQAAKERGEYLRAASKADGIDPDTGEVTIQPTGEI
jgi:hypothetical protein